MKFQIHDEVEFAYDDFFTALGHIRKINVAGREAEVSLEYLHNFAHPQDARIAGLQFPMETFKRVSLDKLTFLSGTEDETNL